MSVSKTLPRSPGTFPPNAVDPTRRLVQMGVRLTIAAAVGCAAGALTQWSVLHLPYKLEPLSNSAAPWVLLAFAVALTARSIGESLTLAVVTLVALVLGFYVAEAFRGWSVSQHQVAFWCVTSMVMGPMIGLAANWLRRSGQAMGALGAGVLGGLLVGEAVHGLAALKFSTSANYWDVQFVVGVGLTLGLTLWRSRGRWVSRAPTFAVSIATGTIVALGTFVAYQIS
jgi:hypothetical protein